MDINVVVSRVFEAPGINVFCKYLPPELKMEVEAVLAKELFSMKKSMPGLTEDEAVELLTVRFFSVIK